MTEADTCREHVTPKLVEAGWSSSPCSNPDIKNTHAKAGLEHADPKDLIASMRSHEAEVLRPLGEIESLGNEVQA